MTRKNLALRIPPGYDLRDAVRTIAEWGLGAMAFDAIGPLAPRELSRTGRREIRALMNSGGIALQAVAMPMRRSIVEIDQWDDRVSRMQAAMEMAYELGTGRVCLSPGAVPADEIRRTVFKDHLRQLADAAEEHGVILTCEVGLDPFASLVETVRDAAHPNLSVSLDPGRLVVSGQDVVASAESAHDLIGLVYATDPEFQGLGLARRGQAVDWARLRETLEEISYRGRLTIWPDATADLLAVVPEMGRRLQVTPKF